MDKILKLRPTSGVNGFGGLLVFIGVFLLGAGLYSESHNLTVSSAPLFVVGIPCLLYASGFEIDGRNYAIRKLSGVWPFVKRSEVPFDANDQLVLTAVEVRSAKGSPYLSVRLILRRSDGNETILDRAMDNWKEVAQSASKTTALLNLPLVKTDAFESLENGRRKDLARGDNS